MSNLDEIRENSDEYIVEVKREPGDKKDNCCND